MTYPYPWQQTQWQQLQTSRQNNRMPHALLLAGSAGLGKRDFACALAKNLLCEPTDVKANELFAAGTHPDFFVITLEEDSKAIKVDQIRELIASVNQTAQYGGYQVVIIEPAEALNIAAANALLKTLEEPQGKVVLILVSAQPSLLSATIRSRCQRIAFNTPALSIAEEWLQNKLPAGTDVSSLLAHAEGAPLAALALSQNSGIEQRAQLLQQLRQIKAGELNPIAIAAQYAKEDVVMCINNMISLVQDMLRNQQEIRLFSFLDLLGQRKNLLLHHNGINAQLLLEEIFISWVQKC